MLNRCLVRRRFLWTMLAVWSGLNACKAFSECQFKDTTSNRAVTYRISAPDTSSGRQFAITMTFRVEADLPVKVEVPSEWIGDLRAVEPAADLKRDPSSGGLTVSSTEQGIVTLSYTLRNGWSGPLVHPHEFQPVIRSAYAEITGDKALVWLQRDHVPQVTANFDWQGLPPQWALATSFGIAAPIDPIVPGQTTLTPNDRCQTYRGPWTSVNGALFAAGDFRLHPFQIGRKPGMLAVRGAWTFSDDDAAEKIGRTIQTVRDFWHDDAFPFFLVTLQPFDLDHGSSDGTAYTDAFWMYVSRKDYINGLLSQLAHECFHAWNPQKMGSLSSTEDEETEWFKEGFTEYYAQKLTHAAGERSAEQVVASINNDLLAFPSSTNEYVRGRIIALWLDAAIRERSSNQHSLDDVMFRLVQDRQDPLTEERIYATIQPCISGEQLSALRNAADYGADLPAPEMIPGLEGCYHAVHGEFPHFALGFNRSASRVAKALSGVDPSGPAYKAGLRDGQPFVALEADPGDIEKQAMVTVRIDGQDRRISFSPIGKATMAWQYRSVAGACSSQS